MLAVLLNLCLAAAQAPDDRWISSQPLWKLYDRQGKLIGVEPGPKWRAVTSQHAEVQFMAPSIFPSASLGKPVPFP